MLGAVVQRGCKVNLRSTWPTQHGFGSTISNRWSSQVDLEEEQLNETLAFKDLTAQPETASPLVCLFVCCGFSLFCFIYLSDTMNQLPTFSPTILLTV